MVKLEQKSKRIYQLKLYWRKAYTASINTNQLVGDCSRKIEGQSHIVVYLKKCPPKAINKVSEGGSRVLKGCDYNYSYIDCSSIYKSDDKKRVSVLSNKHVSYFF